MQKQNLIFATVAVLLMVFTGALFQVSENKIHKVNRENIMLRAEVDSLGEQTSALSRVVADQSIMCTQIIGGITQDEALRLLKKNHEND